MQWIITRDHISLDPNEKPTVGRGSYDNAQAASNFPYRFKLYDDDGVLYYEGRSDDRDSQRAFDPLDWADAYAGCTRIDYLRDGGKWEAL
jgi:hypothetical protein